MAFGPYVVDSGACAYNPLVFNDRQRSKGVSFVQQRLAVLTGLRFVAASMIFVFHFFPHADQLSDTRSDAQPSHSSVH
jgi:hypothetical protein